MLVIVINRAAVLASRPMDDDKAFEILDAQGSKSNPLPAVTRRHDGFSRADVVQAFGRAFTMIGGVQRLALWANTNPTEFYRLFARLMPSTSINFGDNTQVQVFHAIPKTDLDNH